MRLGEAAGLEYGEKLEKNGRPFYLMQCSWFGDGRRGSFWKDFWCGEEALCTSFPSMFELTTHKDAMVADVWDSAREGGCWFPCIIDPSMIVLNDQLS